MMLNILMQAKLSGLQAPMPCSVECSTIFVLISFCCLVVMSHVLVFLTCYIVLTGSSMHKRMHMHGQGLNGSLEPSMIPFPFGGALSVAPATLVHSAPCYCHWSYCRLPLPFKLV